MKDIVATTRRYEAWLRTQVSVVDDDIDEKHEKMCESAFVFLRATYYAWAVAFPPALPELWTAPRVTAIGDLHIENFGTWRDAEGRLAFGVNDFDEAAELPYTSDLVRLATSVALADTRLQAPARELSDVFLDAYATALAGADGRPIVLAERQSSVSERIIRKLVRPREFWKKKLRRPKDGSGAVPSDCDSALRAALPQGAVVKRTHSRQAGVGSLGRPRFVVVARWAGGRVAREAKAFVPSGAVWAGVAGQTRDAFGHLLDHAVRSRDPFLHRRETWVVRRLAPDSDKISIQKLGRAQELELAEMLGHEVANVHLATPEAVPAILADLKERKTRDRDWLRRAARTMAGLHEVGHAAWQRKH